LRIAPPATRIARIAPPALRIARIAWPALRIASTAPLARPPALRSVLPGQPRFALPGWPSWSPGQPRLASPALRLASVAPQPVTLVPWTAPLEKPASQAAWRVQRTGQPVGPTG